MTTGAAPQCLTDAERAAGRTEVRVAVLDATPSARSLRRWPLRILTGPDPRVAGSTLASCTPGKEPWTTATIRGAERAARTLADAVCDDRGYRFLWLEVVP